MKDDAQVPPRPVRCSPRKKRLCSVRRAFANVQIWNSVVEAAGVEPASEKARHEKPTCVSSSVVVGRRIRNWQESDSLARLISAYGSEQKPSAQSREMTSY